MFCFHLKFSDQVLSITPNTQEQVDILKNISTQHEVKIRFFYPIPLRHLPPAVIHYKTYFLPDSLVAACLGPVHQRGDSGPPVRPSEQLGDRQGRAAKSRHRTRVSCSAEGPFAAEPMREA